MKSVQINATSGVGSTGKICESISNMLDQSGIENYIFYTGKKSRHPNAVCYMSVLEIKIIALLSRITGCYGFQANGATRRLLRNLCRIQPDIVHLHNIHGHNCNLELLFRYFHDKKIKVIWTFHDCWAFTGYCTHFDIIGCEKWTEACENCPQYRHYSCYFDRSNDLFNRKKALFTGVDLTVVTPSQWLADHVRHSFLRDCDIRVIPNGIDLDIFQPRQSVFRKKHGCEGKFIILGVAFGWNDRKGLDVFINLAKRLGSEYRVILVGTDEAVDRRLPPEIVSIHRTMNQTELAEIYTAADVFLNVSREENYPTVNMEALACGTPILTFRTGGSAEIISDACGISVEKNDEEALYQKILKMREEGNFSQEECLRRAVEFDAKRCFCAYEKLYSE